MKKKMITIMLAASMTAAMLAGCGGSGDSNQKDSNANADDSQNSSAADTGGSQETSTDAAKDGDTADTGDKTVLKWAIWDEKTAPYWQAIIDA